MTYEQIMYEKVLAHTDCRNLKEILGHVEEESAIEITNYHDGANVAIECTKCNEVIIDFDRSEVTE